MNVHAENGVGSIFTFFDRSGHLGSLFLTPARENLQT